MLPQQVLNAKLFHQQSTRQALKLEVEKQNVDLFVVSSREIGFEIWRKVGCHSKVCRYV